MQKVQLYEKPTDALLKNVDVDLYNKIDKDHQQTIIRAALSKLSESCQKILQLFYYKRCRTAEISLQLGYKNEEVVRSQKLRCINQLRKLVKRNHF